MAVSLFETCSHKQPCREDSVFSLTKFWRTQFSSNLFISKRTTRGCLILGVLYFLVTQYIWKMTVLIFVTSLKRTHFQIKWKNNDQNIDKYLTTQKRFQWKNNFLVFLLLNISLLIFQIKIYFWIFLQSFEIKEGFLLSFWAYNARKSIAV